MKVLCINSANKPGKIPIEEWIEEGKIYTLVKAVQMGLQKGQIGYKLKEVSLSSKSFPYEYYDAIRFAIIVGEHVENEEVVSEEIEISI